MRQNPMCRCVKRQGPDCIWPKCMEGAQPLAPSDGTAPLQTPFGPSSPPIPGGVTVPARFLTEDDVRRIVRDEIAKWAAVMPEKP